jgi:WD40 repeat protein
MHRLVACLVAIAAVPPAAMAAPLPKRERPAISVENADRVRAVGELPHDVWQMAWGPGPRELALIGWETPVTVLATTTLKPARTLAEGRKLTHYAFAPGGRAHAWSENTPGVELHDAATGKSVRLETKAAQASLAFSPDGKLLAASFSDTQVRLYEVPSGKFIWTLDAGGAGGLTPVFSPDGQLLAVGNRNHATRLFDVATGKLRHGLPRAMTQQIKFSPDGRTLAAAYVDGVVGVWDVAAGKLLRERASGAKELYALDWSPKGDVLVTSGREGPITLWEPSELKVLRELEAPAWVIQVRFGPGGRELYSAGGGESRGPDRKVVVWGLPD